MKALIAQAQQVTAEALVQLHSCIERCTKALADDPAYDKELVCHLAYLTQQVIGIMGSLQKLEPEKTRKSDDLPPDLASLFRR